MYTKRLEKCYPFARIHEKFKLFVAESKTNGDKRNILTSFF
ncbi:hypothetical protein B4113_0585 [Geobacillus sp. B4113_201601]|nr:hypothetical protein B4113_0585 [Geobacillus sp. B4113_201601]